MSGYAAGKMAGGVMQILLAVLAFLVVASCLFYLFGFVLTPTAGALLAAALVYFLGSRYAGSYKPGIVRIFTMAGAAAAVLAGSHVAASYGPIRGLVSTAVFSAIFIMLFWIVGAVISGRLEKRKGR